MKTKKTINIYNSNSKKWIRNKPVCLSDFTARDHIFKLIKSLKNKNIADLGCGEGYCANYFKKQGAKKIFGIDLSNKMINLAKQRNLDNAFFKKASITNTRLKSNFFDIVFAIFVFNYLKKKEMLKACKEIYRITKRNGKVYITIPHPFYPFLSQKNDIFYFRSLIPTDYINKIDYELDGYISRLDKIKLPVKIIHHMLEDYFNAFRLAGFKTILEFKELKVSKKNLKKNKKFFNKVKDLPLHILFILEKK